MGDKMESVWSESIEFNKRSALEKDLTVDTVIIGAGMTGILLSYLLNKNGIENTIIEASEICSGQTKNTTAKITSQHSLIYNKIEKYYGEESARQYANANEKATADFKTIIDENKIDCEYKQEKAILYSVKETEPLLMEYESAKKAGIDCYYTDKTTLPFEVKGALVFNNQAKFNPLKFIKGIEDDLTIYTNTKATRIVNNTVYTKNAKIYAKHIVVATHYPFVNFPSLYFLKISQERSYALALKNCKYNPDAMYIGIDKNSSSLREYKDYLILGGCNHRTGKKLKYSSFDTLYNKALDLFPSCEKVYEWSAQDCITIDDIPYIGKFNIKNSNIFIATGYNKWGMSTSMVSANIICDMICNKNVDKYEIFFPSRFNLPASIRNIMTNIKETAKGFAAHLNPLSNELDKIQTCTAIELVYDGVRAGAYKDTDNKIYIVSLVCPHLKCKLNWNNSTKTWDCPCHGSRYSYKGELIDNPSQAESILIGIKQP